MTNQRLERTIECAAINLFALQALRVYLSMLFGCLYDVIFDGEGVALLLAAVVATVGALIAPLLASRGGEGRRLWWAVAVCAAARIAVSVDHLAISLIGAAVALGAAAYYVAVVLDRDSETLISGLALGLFLDQVLRALGQTYDLSLRAWWLPAQVVLSGGLVWLARANARQQEVGRGRPSHGAGFTGGMAYGAALFLFTSLLALPNAAARWTGSSYALLVIGGLALNGLLLWPWTRAWAESGALMCDRWWRAGLAVLALAGLGVADGERGLLSTIAFLEAAGAVWLLLPRSLRAGSRGRAHLGVCVGLVLWLLLSTMHAFSYVYPYTVTLFRGAELPVVLLGAALVVAPAIAKTDRQDEAEAPIRWPGWCRTIAWGLALAAVVVAIPRSPKGTATGDTVLLGTYNIHYGFDTYWHRSLDEQARTLIDSGADLVALQEVDAGRLTSFGIDNALWLARRTGMEAIYLPTVEHGTGIALLSRWPVSDRGGIALPSEDEPTGMVRATVMRDGTPLHFYGIWLGLSPDERARQLVAGLEAIADREPAVLAGDMNATPDSPIYGMMVAAGFDDPFEVLGKTPAPTDPAIDPHKRIDYVWLRGLDATDAIVLDSLASDHRMVLVEARGGN